MEEDQCIGSQNIYVLFTRSTEENQSHKLHTLSTNKLSMLCHDKSRRMKGIIEGFIDFQIRCSGINISTWSRLIHVSALGIILSPYLLLLIFRICAVQILRWNSVANSLSLMKFTLTSSLRTRGFLLWYIDDAYKLPRDFLRSFLLSKIISQKLRSMCSLMICFNNLSNFFSSLEKFSSRL